MREGTPLSIDFFKRHAWFILIAMVVVIALIGQRYTNKSKMREIRELTKELASRKPAYKPQGTIYEPYTRKRDAPPTARKAS